MTTRFGSRVYSPTGMTNHRRYMQRALELAEKGRYSVSPNPMVGAVLVREGEIIGEGWHQRAGEPHAEIEAMRRIGGKATGATLYVTLEPCCHQGRTPPCTDALLESGLTRIEIAAPDPSSHAGGKGIETLRRAGIEVEVGLCREEAERQNEVFLHAASHATPFVLLKAGMTLDGKIATTTRESRWITSPQSRERSLALREEYDAILVGSGTVVADDPRLTRRLGLNTSIQPWLRVIVDGEGGIPENATVLDGRAPTIVFTAHPERYRSKENVEIIDAKASAGRIDLEFLLHHLRDREVRSLIVEGGSGILTAMIRERLWQKMQMFIAPTIVGGTDAPSIFGGEGMRELGDAHRLRFDSVERVGPDLLITAYPV